MRYISLGRNCDVAFNLRRENKMEGETGFFDWVRSDFECILQILTRKTVDEIFQISNLHIDLEEWKHQGDVQITMHSFERQQLVLLFHHEFKIQVYVNSNSKEKEKLLKCFIERYQRRFERLLSYIQNDKQKLIFVYRVTSTWQNSFISEFHAAIIAINPNACYILAVIVEDIEDINCPYIQMSKECFKINVNAFLHADLEGISLDWQNLHFKWNKIFDLMEQLTSI
jgi:hypothetical protein